MLCIGGFIYIAFRPQSIYIFQYLDFLSLSDYVCLIREHFSDVSLPDFMIFALPDGLWIASYILIMISIWWKRSEKQQMIFCSILPVIGISSELGQYCGFVKGTADFADIVCYTVPFICYLLVKFKTNKLHINKQ